MSLQRNIRRAQQQAQAEARGERVQRELQVSGDGLELAARVAARTPQIRPVGEHESPEFTAGHRTACAELSVVFRAMRRGTPPDRDDMAEAIRAALAKGMVPQ